MIWSQMSGLADGHRPVPPPSASPSKEPVAGGQHAAARRRLGFMMVGAGVRLASLSDEQLDGLLASFGMDLQMEPAR